MTEETGCALFILFIVFVVGAFFIGQGTTYRADYAQGFCDAMLLTRSEVNGEYVCMKDSVVVLKPQPK